MPHDRGRPGAGGPVLVCDAPAVDAGLFFIAAETVILAVLVAMVWERGAVIERVRELTGGRTDEIEPRLRALRGQLDNVEWQNAQLLRDVSVLADLSGVGVVRLDDDARVDFANLTAHGLLDRAPGSMIGLTAIEAFIDRRIEEIADTALRTGYGNGELRVRDADGPVYAVRARRSATSGVWLVLQDVSELRMLQRIRTEFLENLSHELRTPLSTVSLLTETLAREADQVRPPVPARMRDRIAKIEVETGHLVQMVNELLDLTRIETGGPIQLLHDVDLGRLATASVDRLRLFAERQGVMLRTDVEPGLPPVRGDEERLGQVMVNLLHNAVKFSPEGGDVLVRVRNGGTDVVTSVQDHGVGIPRAAQARIFERFYKVDRARVRGGGTGLGLSIARHVVEGHNGRIWVDSEEGAGSTFSFALPVAPDHHR
jgi:two-component system phosphate regulon sensor histidine kinase PhoR